MLSLEDVRATPARSGGLGVREYYFTGGEPFLNPEMMPRSSRTTLGQGPATVLTNGLLLTPERCRRASKRLSDESEYSLDIRISIDGLHGGGRTTPIRGAGTFERILEGIRNLADAGLNPVVTVTRGLRCRGERRRDAARLLGVDAPDRPRRARA